ncbi:MAG: extracellular solute-binding protein [Thermogemmatispora sp.]|jgi:alpha-glucoside transport system substrate-binding protein|uniref:Sugar ABC transporter substrate-binding protein n=1 Tax=Thermogemmatispora aurantia TaxID=2045279 RepID=A0A5J4JU89_9CHLR|nr:MULTISPECIES: extracellular solute-binding protein [Thermogemmatispora]MBE3567084.1 extracellular solute-binding protein [Thermogemmatispora sp.]GER81394.1 sugar ABC transporter substrate-binding protein [Thermogemmatispora aurantia]
MFIYDRQQREALDRLVEDLSEHRIGRRVFLQRAMALGLTASAAASVLAACGTPSTTGGSSTPATVSSIDVLNVWSGEEQQSFDAVVTPFESQSKITVKIEATRDLDAVLTSRLRGGNPPDIAVLPNPGKMQQLASQGKLIPLDSFLDMNKVKSDYASTWIDLGSYNGRLYALFYKAANKGTIWYNPTQFQAIGGTIPKTWDDLIKLSDMIAGKGKYPWSMGVESGSASGWPAADWVDEIFLLQSGPDLYDQWVNHKIPWTHSSVKQAFQTFAQIVTGKHYINGAPQSILATNFQDASYAPFKNPPEAYLYYLGDFTAGFITAQFKSAQPGKDFNFFPFPTINPQYQGAVTGGADVIVALRDNNGVRELVKYLETAQAQEIWVKRGGFTSPSKAVSLSAYPNDVARASAQMLTSATIFRFGADDLMPPAMETAYWKAMLDFIKDPTKLDSILSSLESTAQQAYASS